MSNCIKYISHSKAQELLNDCEKEAFSTNKTTIIYKKQEVILKQGTIVHNILFIKKGLVKVYLEGKQKEIILALKNGGTYIGLSGLHSVSKTHPYSIAALEDCEIESYDINQFKEVLSKNVAFSNEMIKYINHNSARIYNRFLCVAEKNARGKVADMILCLANIIYESDQFTIPMSRKELSEFVGLSMENTIRILKEFESDKMISLKGKEFEILDKDKLDRVSEYG